MNYALHIVKRKNAVEIVAKNSSKKVLARAAGPDALPVLQSVLMQVDPRLAVEFGADPRAVLDHVLGPK